MRRVVSSAALLVAAALSIAACASHAESVPSVDAPHLSAIDATTSLVLAAAELPAATDESTAPMQVALTDTPTSSCPDGMVLAEGSYCSEVRQDCLTWEDPPSTRLARCAEFAESKCVGVRVHKRFCIDRDEYVEAGESLPMGDASWSRARAICETMKKRLCKETEWEFACEGEQMFAYPTGQKRGSQVCNFDKGDLVDPRTGKLRDQRMPAAELEGCLSPFGVRNMSGNVDEWVWRDRNFGQWRSALKGGWWMPARDRCRAATTAHDEDFHGLQTGVRCCADAP